MLENHFIVNPSRFTSDSAPPLNTDAVVVATVLVEDGNRWLSGINDDVVVKVRTFPPVVVVCEGSGVSDVVRAGTEAGWVSTFPMLEQKPSSPAIAE